MKIGAQRLRDSKNAVAMRTVKQFRSNRVGKLTSIASPALITKTRFTGVPNESKVLTMGTFVEGMAQIVPFTKNDGVDGFHNSRTKAFAVKLIITVKTPLIIGENLNDGDLMKLGKISFAVT